MSEKRGAGKRSSKRNLQLERHSQITCFYCMGKGFTCGMILGDRGYIEEKLECDKCFGKGYLDEENTDDSTDTNQSSG